MTFAKHAWLIICVTHVRIQVLHLKIEAVENEINRMSEMGLFHIVPKKFETNKSMKCHCNTHSRITDDSTTLVNGNKHDKPT